MRIYNINLGIGLASSGVEYAQSYRYKVFKYLGLKQKYIFLDAIGVSSTYNLAKNIGIAKEDVFWFYDVLTGARMVNSKLDLPKLESLFEGYQKDASDLSKVYFHKDKGTYVLAFEDPLSKGFYNRLEYVVDYCLVRKDYYSGLTVCCSEYYTPTESKAYLYKREFYKNGKVALTEHVHTLDDSSFFYNGLVYPTKESLFGVFMDRLGIEEEDWVLLDRSTGTGKAVFTRKRSIGFRLGVVVHAEHFIRESVSEYGVLFNNYYEYQFKNRDLVDAFICSTKEQADLLSKHLGLSSGVFVAPAGFLNKLHYPKKTKEDKTKFITVSRLSEEKNLDLLIKAVTSIQGTCPITLDIYGEGVERSNLESLIKENNLKGVVTLKGHCDMSKVYKDYYAYVTASFAEGFGLSLMEAVGSGLPIVGYDVPYGNTNFVDEGRTGYLYPVNTEDLEDERNVKSLAQAILRVYRDGYSESDLYDKAKPYLLENVAKAWKGVLGGSFIC